MCNSIIEQLMPLTDSELKYSKGKTSHYLSALPYIVINKKDVAYMKYSGAPHKAHPFIQVNKHSRFQDWPMHCHDWIEINYLLQGSCTQILNDTEYLIHEGSLVLLDIMTPHTIKKLRKEDLLIYICISKEYLNSSFFYRFSSNSILLDFFINSLNQKINNNHYVIFEKGSKKLNDLMLIFLTEWLNPSLSHTDMLDSLFAAIVSELINLYHFSISSTGQEIHPKVFDILKYIEKNYQTCSLHALSKEFNLNSNYLSNLLKQQTGSNYQQLVQLQRISIAKKLLSHTHLSITSIGNEVGYENMNFFYKKFKDEIGMTPGEFRKKNVALDK